jgi:hypothetical protein
VMAAGRAALTVSAVDGLSRHDRARTHVVGEIMAGAEARGGRGLGKERRNTAGAG